MDWVQRLGLVLAIAMVGSCYSPTVRDCTVTCDSSHDCIGGQLCGSDHFCAMPEVASHCAGDLAPDASLTKHLDGGGADAVVGSDAASATVILHLHDDGNGEIAIVGGASCATSDPQHGDCMIAVPSGVLVVLQASGQAPNVFMRWEGQVCSGTNPSCSFVPNLPTSDIHAKFDHP